MIEKLVPVKSIAVINQFLEGGSLNDFPDLQASFTGGQGLRCLGQSLLQPEGVPLGAVIALKQAQALAEENVPWNMETIIK